MAFYIDKECIKNVHKLISNVILSFKGLKIVVRCIAQQIIKKHTETCSNKIDGQLITKAVLEDTGMLANFPK